MEYLVVIPTFQEYENLIGLIPGILESDKNANVIIVDDDTNDGTENLILKYQDKYKNRLDLISRKEKNSYAESLLIGIKLGYTRGFKRIIQMDADGSHSINDIPKLLLCNSDIVIGSRYLKGSQVLNVSLTRQLISILGNLYISLIWKTRIRDKTNGFRLFNERALSELSNFDNIARGFAVQIDVLNYLRQSKHFQIKEVPVKFVFRNLGKSKFDFKKIIEAFYHTTFRH